MRKVIALVRKRERSWPRDVTRNTFGLLQIMLGTNGKPGRIGRDQMASHAPHPPIVNKIGDKLEPRKSML